MFAAGIVPGLLAVALYTIVINIWITIDPKVAPAQTKKTSRSAQLKSLANTWQMLVIFLIVIGGIIGGFFPPSEGGAIGCAALLILGILTRDLKLSDYFAALFEATMTTTLLYLIILAVSVFNFFISETKIPLELASYLKSLTLSNDLILLQIIGILILLGCILDALSLVFITIPFIFPIVKSFGFDPIWFGILMIVVIEIGVITPPIGLNIFALQKAVNGIRAKDIFKGVGPFIVADFIRIILLFTFPSIALWLPNWLYGVSL
jgi:tripartite ATP-independent transporter DctM subunit